MPPTKPFSALLSVFILLSSSGALYAEDDSVPYDIPLIRPGVRGGEGKTPFYQDYFVPVHATKNKVYFFNFKNVFGNRGDTEQNIGFAYRSLSSNEDSIFGINAFFDNRFTENNNYLRQIGFGIERLSNPIDLRLNVYFPITDKKLLSENQSFAFSSSNIIRTTQRTYEEPLPGLDFEIGYLIPKVSDYVETRLRVGGYYYNSDLTKDILGYRIALEARPSRALTLELELKDDTTIDPEFYIGAYLTLPFDLGKLLKGKNPFEGLEDYLRWQKGPRPLRQRMSDVIIRDIDIVAKDSVQTQGENTLTKLIYVNNTNSTGVENGTLEHPYNTLAEGISASTTDNEWIYVDAGDGTATGYTGNYTLKANTTLWGEGYQAFPGLGGGSRPLLKATGGSGTIVSMPSNNTVQGLEFQDAVQAIQNTGAGTFMVRNNTISSITGGPTSDDDGVGISSASTSSSVVTVYIMNNTISSVNSGAGDSAYCLAFFALDSSTLTAHVSGNTLQTAEFYGINTIVAHTANQYLSLTRNTIKNNSDVGILALNLGTGSHIVDLGGGSLGSPGFNAIFSNSGSLFNATGNDNLKAENNYWGGGAGSFAGPNTVDGSPFLTSNPN